ncbi:MAG: hypothetical protein ISR95_05575 [Candidatus Marinimicrobia bacterium]|nr:hypothetical protein [Candidatus Neomarinimicrobiota bacterium]
MNHYSWIIRHEVTKTRRSIDNLVLSEVEVKELAVIDKLEILIKNHPFFF